MSRTALSLISILGVVILLIVVNSLIHRGLDEPMEDQTVRPAKPLHRSGVTRTLTAPEYPLKYSLGPVDPRFGTSEETLIRCAAEAGAVWEAAARLKLFQYDASSDFHLNLVFDERQARRNEQRMLKSRLDSRGNSYDILMRRYDDELKMRHQQQEEFEAEVRDFQPRLDAYNIRTASWNSKGGAPADEYARLAAEKEYLDRTGAQIERKRQTLNNTVSEVNALAEAINEIISRNNLDIRNFNGKFVQSREFEKGVFDGTAINIYEFDGEADLRLTLVHELGHALGFGHVDDPDAVMFYKLEKQDTSNIRLTNADLKLVGEIYQRTRHE